MAGITDDDWVAYQFDWAVFRLMDRIEAELGKKHGKSLAMLLASPAGNGHAGFADLRNLRGAKVKRMKIPESGIW